MWRNSLNRIVQCSPTRHTHRSIQSYIPILIQHNKITTQQYSSIRVFSAVAPDQSHNDFAPAHKQSSSSSSGSVSDIDTLIKHDIENNPVFLYMKGTPDAPRCGFSANVCRILQHLNTSFASRDVLQSEELRDGLKTFSDWYAMKYRK